MNFTFLLPKCKTLKQVDELLKTGLFFHFYLGFVVVTNRNKIITRDIYFQTTEIIFYVKLLILELYFTRNRFSNCIFYVIFQKCTCAPHRDLICDY